MRGETLKERASPRELLAHHSRRVARMKINVVCHDLSNNCLGRAHVLARLVARAHDVDIVGRMRGAHLWEPLRSDSAVPVKLLPHCLGLRRPLAALDRDLVYAVKPEGGSPALGLFRAAPRPAMAGGDGLPAHAAQADPSFARLVVCAGEKLPERPYLRVIGPQPFSTLPRFLALADVVVLAQRRNRIGTAQLPAKVFDAMAMARPVIATRVSDLPEVLEGCGVIVEPNSIVELAQAIARLMANPEERSRLGSRARQRFVDQFSEDVVAPRLASVVDEAMALAGR